MRKQLNICEFQLNRVKVNKIKWNKRNQTRTNDTKQNQVESMECKKLCKAVQASETKQSQGKDTVGYCSGKRSIIGCLIDPDLAPARAKKYVYGSWFKRQKENEDVSKRKSGISEENDTNVMLDLTVKINGPKKKPKIPNRK